MYFLRKHPRDVRSQHLQMWCEVGDDLCVCIRSFNGVVCSDGRIAIIEELDAEDGGGYELARRPISGAEAVVPRSTELVD
jgi:hypothetical protein